ncbi:MAG: 2-isopropylmalate synthase [Alphaproteobacteria bacterium]|uniref:2-isopropylmalate synthase n=1 Tax=Candidatus Nitrobium versatile TaxID=2884831 RepID=A0A953M273_9BACT|nr:2-isopropylmalate synthase [Candidatus Nitrobium versatile]
MPVHKYRAYPTMDLPDRSWPAKTIVSAPRWCSVDLRDGNQALIIPMSVEEKREMFFLLVEIGFKEIEVGFPSASKTEYDFMRRLIDENLIPEEVTIQVLTQAREHLIRKTFEALQGARRAIVHLYNSTSVLQRRVVFRMEKREIMDLAVKGAEIIRREAEKLPGTEITYEYSPESFTGTEPGFAVEICRAVMEVWEPTAERRVILNLPATVEMATPNVYADQIEWFCRHIGNREAVVISAHAHNDRGTAVAATELALMAGAERVEGTLFGNGERTGNVDVVTLALNMFSQGVDPHLDFHDIDRVIGVYERCTKVPVHIRHPYAGELVYTAFSGSHQDAVNKGVRAYQEERPEFWEVPYLPIDPADVGRTFESVIRINSQSGKGGVAYVMEREYGFLLPKEMHPEFGRIIQGISDATGKEVLPGMIREAFEKEYLGSTAPLGFGHCRIKEKPEKEHEEASSRAKIKASVRVAGRDREIEGKGNGPIDAFSNALREELGLSFMLLSYHEHALEQGSDSKAVAYIGIEDSARDTYFGAGVDTNIDIASFKAILSALNRSPAIRKQLEAEEQEKRYRGAVKER